MLGSLLALVCATGCHGHDRQIVLLPPTTGVVLWDSAHAGAATSARKCGLRVRYDAPTRGDDLQRQLAMFETFRAERYGGIILQPIQAQALRNPVQRAVSSGLPVVLLGSDMGIRSPNLAYVRNDEKFGGVLAADRLAELLPSGGRIAVLGLDVDRPSTLEREASLEQRLRERYKRLIVSDRRSGSSNLAQEQQSAQQILRSSPRVDAIVALSAVSTRGAYYAVMSEKLARHVVMIGFDQDMLPPVRTGQLDAVVAERTSDMGARAAEAICARLSGRPMPPEALIRPFLITPANISSPEVRQQLSVAWWESEQE
jgi:ribose transport system substrate-binding protein